MSKNKIEFFLFLLIGLLSVPLYLAFCFYLTKIRGNYFLTIGIRPNDLDLLATYILAMLLGFAGGGYLLDKLSQQKGRLKDVFHSWLFSGGLFLSWTIIQTISQPIGSYFSASKQQTQGVFFGSVGGAVVFLIVACGVLAWFFTGNKSEDEEKPSVIQGITPKDFAEMPEVVIPPKPDFTQSRMWKVASRDFGIFQLKDNGEFSISGLSLNQQSELKGMEINGISLNKEIGESKELIVKNLSGEDFVFKFEKGEWFIKRNA